MYKFRKEKSELQNYAEAVKWYRLAAEQAHPIAQKALGVMYKYGKGVPRDSVRSYIWYSIAIINGTKISPEQTDETAAKMTSADISEAQKMARECMNSNYQNCGW